MKILLIDDDQRLLDALVTAFRFRWPEADIQTATEGEAGLELMASDDESGEQPPDLVVLDIGLPDRSGFDVLADIRRTSNVPIVLLTAAKEELEHVRGLELGADDYLTKPFGSMALLAHVKAVLRRAHPLSDVSSRIRISAGQIRLDEAHRELIGPAGRVRLTPIEFRLIHYLMLNAGHVVYQSSLIRRVWGNEEAATSHDLRMFIAKLRAKLASAGAPRAIVTERGIGYSVVSTG